MQLSLWLSIFCVLNSPTFFCRVQITTFNIFLVVLEFGHRAQSWSRAMGHGPASEDDDDGDDGSSSKASHTQLMRCSCSALAMHVFLHSSVQYVPVVPGRPAALSNSEACMHAAAGNSDVTAHRLRWTKSDVVKLLAHRIPVYLLQNWMAKRPRCTTVHTRTT